MFDPEKEITRVNLGRPTLTYKGPIGSRDASELLSVLEQMLSKGSRVLDLGCGPRDQAEPISSLGFEYVGIDLASPNADVRADALALPFEGATYDCVFSFAVLEHLSNPFAAFDEIKRVLRPGGIYCGTVSQGEPFHNSFFHHTAWGLLSLTHATGLEALRLWACWDTLSALADMGRYPRVVRAGMRLLDHIHSRLPFLAPRKMRWSAEARYVDTLHRAASIGFIIRKPNVSAGDGQPEDDR